MEPDGEKNDITTSHKVKSDSNLSNVAMETFSDGLSSETSFASLSTYSDAIGSTYDGSTPTPEDSSPEKTAGGDTITHVRNSSVTPPPRAKSGSITVLRVKRPSIPPLDNTTSLDSSTVTEQSNSGGMKTPPVDEPTPPATPADEKPHHNVLDANAHNSNVPTAIPVYVDSVPSTAAIVDNRGDDANTPARLPSFVEGPVNAAVPKPTPTKAVDAETTPPAPKHVAEPIGDNDHSSNLKDVPIDTSVPKTAPTKAVDAETTPPASKRIVKPIGVSDRSPNLKDVAAMSTGPDAELESAQTPLPLKPIRNDLDDSKLGRYSPAQMVAATGGLSPELISDIERDLPDTQPALSDSSACMVQCSTSVSHDQVGSSSATVKIDFQVTKQLEPDSPERVDASSELVFGNFLTERYRLEVTASLRASSSTGNVTTSATATAIAGTSTVNTDPVAQTLASLPTSHPNSMEALVARNLAQIGDEICLQYGAKLDRMIKLLPENECPMELFTKVAKVLFNQGPTNWGQIVTLLYFGYRLVIQRVRSGVTGAFQQVLNCLIGFCRTINIFGWIAARGGWTILQYLQIVPSGNTRNNAQQSHIHTDVPSANPSDISFPLVMVVASVAIAVGLVGWILYTRKR